MIEFGREICGDLDGAERREWLCTNGIGGFACRGAMQRSLDAFIKFYNEWRPHQGYRLHGRTPAELFVGVATRDGRRGSISEIPG